MELRQLTYFVAVAEEEHFTRAAERVSVAQPAVSAQIRRLERELGEALFDRDLRPIRLTDAGLAFLPHARAALAAAERGFDTIASMRGPLCGRLNLGVVKGAVGARLAETLGLYHRMHPAIEIALTEQHNAPLVDTLVSADIDAGVIGIHDQPLPPQIRTRIFATEPLVLGVARGHPLDRRLSVTLEQLRDQPMITLTRGSGLRALLEDACRNAGFVPRIMVETGELASLVTLAAEGLGVAVLPQSAIAANDRNLAVLELTGPRLQRRTALAWREGNVSPAGRAFLALAELRLPEARAESPG